MTLTVGAAASRLAEYAALQASDVLNVFFCPSVLSHLFKGCQLSRPAFVNDDVMCTISLRRGVATPQAALRALFGGKGGVMCGV